MAEFNSLIQNYTVDFASNNNFLFIPSIQGDGNKARYALINLTNNGQPYEVDPEKVRVIIEGKKLDGTQVFDQCEIQDDHVSVLVNITPQMTAVPGKNKYELAIISTTMNIVLRSFPLYIVSTASAFDAEQAISSDEYQVLVKTINDTEALIKDVEAAEGVRSNNESTRMSSEDVRIQNEKNRVNAENARKEAEIVRNNNEITREEHEDVRTTNEQQRIENESTRVEVHNARNTEWLEVLKPDVLAATDNANNTAQTISDQAANGDFSATISSVTAVTGAAGTLAKVENVGTDQNAKLVITVPKGDTGSPFSISKTYSSISEMEAGYATDGLKIGDLVIIETGSVEDLDNAKVYMKSESKYVFLVDLSGSQGIKGETGQAAGFGTPTATVDGNVGTPAVIVTATGDDTAKVFHFEFKNLKGEKGDIGEVDNATPIGFTQASSRSNIVTGEAINILFGKISKYFADLKSVAFSGSYNDLSDKPTSMKNPTALKFTGGSNVVYDGSSEQSVAIPTIPSALKNPNALTFTGAVVESYDGSSPKTVNIPSVGEWSVYTNNGTVSLTQYKEILVRLKVVSDALPGGAYSTIYIPTLLLTSAEDVFANTVITQGGTTEDNCFWGTLYAKVNGTNNSISISYDGLAHWLDNSYTTILVR